MRVSFQDIRRGETYSRPKLAEMWKYRGFQALARGVITPKNEDVIVLFVTEEKQSFQEQYRDLLSGNTLHWEGPTDHFAEDRMTNAHASGDTIHVFHRKRHHSDFTYLGRACVIEYVDGRGSDSPSRFVFRIS